MASLRDGTLLATDLYCNADNLPYDKERSAALEVMTMVQAGYHVVMLCDM